MNSCRRAQLSPPSTENCRSTGWERGSGAALPQPSLRKNWINLIGTHITNGVRDILHGEASGVFVEYLALDRSRSNVSSIRKPSSLKNRWFPLVVMPHFLEGFPPLIHLKCSDSKTPPVWHNQYNGQFLHTKTNPNESALVNLHEETYYLLYGYNTE